MNNMLAIGVVLCLVLLLVGIIGFAYIIFAAANKGSGLVKLAGQIIAVAIVVLSLVIAVVGAPKANLVKRFTLNMGRSVMMDNKCPMMGGQMMKSEKCMMGAEEKAKPAPVMKKHLKHGKRLRGK